MVIYINEGNPYGLKLEICAKAAGTEIPIEFVTVSSERPTFNVPHHLPLLDLGNGQQLFTSDAIVRYLLPDEQPRAQRDQWLEWCSTRLAPAIVHKNTPGHQDHAAATNVLNHLLLQLDATVAQPDTPFLIGQQPSAADYSVWSFLAQDHTLVRTSNLFNLQAWYARVAELAPVRAATKFATAKIDLAALAKANRFGGIAHIRVDVPVVENEARCLADTPSHIAESITPEELRDARRELVFVAAPEKRNEPRTVLPRAGERNVLITSALPYVNNVPHLGNIIGCVLSADIFARYSRMAGYNTLYICGTDEYGTATETKALAENLTPEQICAKYFEKHNNIYRWFGIGFDCFGRTSAPEQTQVVQAVFKEVHAAGYTNIETVDQLLCTKCDRFLADRFVEGTCPHPGCGYEDARGDQCDSCGKLVNAIELIRPRCKQCNSAPIIRESRQFFLDLPKVEQRLIGYLESVWKNWTNNARTITQSWLKEGLKPRCITRDLKWGVPVPHEGFEKKVFYVWFDAVLGYISITSKYTKEWKQWWQPQNKDVKIELFQFMAKDNVPFHSVIFPSILLAMNQGHTKVTHIMATEYLNYEDGKFSKSRGIGVFGDNAQDTGIPADVWRYYLASARPEGQDSNFSWADLVARNNAELLNNLGNFINRALVFCEKNFDSTVAEVKATDDELNVAVLINREIKGYIQSMEKSKLRDGLRHTLSISRHGNQYLQSQQPWVLLKGTAEQKERAATVIAFSCNISCLIATLLSPFMPTTARTIADQLNAKLAPLRADAPFMRLYLKAGHKIGKPLPLFTKIEQQRLDELKKQYGGVQDTNKAGSKSATAFKSVADAEAAIQAQGDKVRQLKQSGADKTAVQPEVDILLAYKKQLVALQAGTNDTAPTDQSSTIKDVEQKITEQGIKVRKLKASGDKAVWQPEVNVLLALKKQLAELQSTAPAAAATKASAPANAAAIKELEVKVAEQGEKVRQLKAAKADKSAVQSEVNALLALKSQLIALGGTVAGAPATSGGKKKK